MKSEPFVSICVPTYNQTFFLKKTLDSIAIQSYQNFEVIISDDSTNNEVKDLCEGFKDKFILRYFRNEIPLGPPANWNNAIDKAKGDFIKILHHDDWFASKDSLHEFAQIISNSNVGFAFCVSEILNVAENKITYNEAPEKFLREIKKDPRFMFDNNRIGSPSAVIFKKSDLRFDNNLKFLVDIDFYIRYLQNASFIYIRKPLIINTSNHAGQVTASSMNKETQVKEYTYLYNKIFDGKVPGLRLSIFFYRLFKYYKIKQSEDIIKVNGVMPRPGMYFKMLLMLSNVASVLSKE